jgi:cell fate regulator YaaT (PSP1 superfamily)
MSAPAVPDAPESPDAPTPVVDAVVEVAFKGNRKEFFLFTGEALPKVGTAVIVEADRGEDYGVVHATGALAETRGRGTAHGYGQGRPTLRLLRLANKGDRARHEDLRRRDEPARREAMERVRHYRLAMKLCDAEWRWDRQRLALYFSSEQRVDFRELVRDLAARFRTRIDLRQIGVRDEAKRLSGIGRCGREYCSAAWLPELKPVNLGVAKEQRLSLNPTQISGACGRLMCCLRYEHDFYVQQRKRFPKDGRIVVTAKGEEKVMALDIFRERVTLRGTDGETRVLALADFQREAAGGGMTPSADAPIDAMDDASEGDVSEFAPPKPAPPSKPRTLPTMERRAPREDTRPKGAAAPPPAVPEAPPSDNARADDRRRRRGRRGGRRHKPGGDAPPSAGPAA